MARKLTPEEAAVEGGLINDRSGKATQRLRKAKYRLPKEDTADFWKRQRSKR